MEELLGRTLLPSEAVHHRNGNKAQNSPWNLQVISPHEHARSHSRSPSSAPLVNICRACGRPFLRTQNTSRPAVSCGRPCSLIIAGAVNPTYTPATRHAFAQRLLSRPTNRLRRP